MTVHLQSVRQGRVEASLQKTFPFNIPTIQGMETLTFTAPVTFLVGENGSGKSTFLEAVACAARLPAAGSADLEGDPTLASVRRLADRLHLAWTKRTHQGFFLRAEDYFGYVKRLAQMREELARDLQQVDEEYQGHSQLAQNLARMPFTRELGELERRYGEGLDTHSHGESFFTFFQARFVPGGLYLLDEPEAALSPLRQLAFLALLKQTVAQNAQFIIATHSPILLAYPGATLLNFDESPVRPVAYDDLEHVRLTRDFLNNPTAFTDRL
ncbi:MAG: AAA family ATPase [Anaerolineaceae bacterium]|nr:AAA family ATPase [Anaerolineaceae bacterium]